MKVDVSAVSNHQKKLTVIVPPADVRAELEKAYRTLSKQVRLPGFRPGKAPRRVLEAQYGERINADVAQELIQRSWTNILEDHELDPVGRPSVDESGEVRDADGFRFTISVDVRPKIELSTWTGLEVVQPPVDVTDDEVDATVKARLEGHAKLEEVTGRACEQGDMALVELHAFDGEDEVATEFGTMIRTEQDPYYPGVESLVVGLDVGGEASGEVEFSEEARTESVAGRTLKVDVKLVALQAYVVPELSDELATELGYENTGDMGTKIREDLVKRRTEGARNQARANVLESIIAANEFDVPDGMVEQSLEMLKQELRSQQAYITGRDPRTIGFSDAQIADLRHRALFAAKASLILEWVTERESIEATDADLDARFEELAAERNQSVEAVKGWFSKEDAVRDLKERIVEEKVLDWLLDQSTIVEGPATPPPAETPTASDDGDTAGADIAVLTGSIDDLKKALASGDHDSGLEALLAAEEAGRGRKGAITAIKSRMSSR